MKRIAIVGATSQIAKDFLISIVSRGSYEPILYARDLDGMHRWLKTNDLPNFHVYGYDTYGLLDHEYVVNFVGVGNPSRALSLGKSIFDITYDFDQMVLRELRKNPSRRYVFLSSGAAYGDVFSKPVDAKTSAAISINSFNTQDCYAVAKMHAEARHRAESNLAIIDVRVFNYFSRTQDFEARFFITDIVRSIKNDSILKVSDEDMVRDFLHPDDFYQLVDCVLNSPPTNLAMDCFTRAPIRKFNLLNVMSETFGLKYECEKSSSVSINATGKKPFYYSMYNKAAEFGYAPAYSSLDTVLREVAAVLGVATPSEVKSHVEK